MPVRSAQKTSKKSDTKEFFIFFINCLAIIALLSLSVVNINKFLNKQKVLGTSATTDTSAIENEKTFWEKLVRENPTYRDGYLELAIIDNTLGNKTDSFKNFEKAKSIDPNSIKITEVQKLLNLGN